MQPVTLDSPVRRARIRGTHGTKELEARVLVILAGPGAVSGGILGSSAGVVVWWSGV